jgi:glycosyltransferase involved in cell wall biosynthesis
VKTIEVSVVVPTRNERQNVGPLMARLSEALPTGQAEVIFVDDSTDDTPDVIAAVAETATLPVLTLHRGPGERAGGLGGAVVAGLRLAVGRVVVVMDGDLQHPPETIPELIRPIELGEADIVVASRYREDGGAGGLATRSRASVSRLATTLTKLVFPRRLQEISDPMSGFFAVRLAAVDIDSLRPVGFKILLEAVARCRLTVAEVGFTFAPRYSGESKASFSEGIRFAGHLTRLRLGTLLTARQQRAAGFAGVGLTGLVVNAVAFWLLIRYGHMHYLAAAAVATQISTTWNFAGMELLVFSDRRSGGMLGRYVRFSVLNNTVMLARLPFLAFLVGVAHTPQLLANTITLLAVFLVRFGISDRFIYEGEGEKKMGQGAASSTVVGPIEILVEDADSRPTTPEPKVVTSFRHYYDIHGIVTIGSDVVLPELLHFLQAKGLGEGTTPDIAIKIGSVGRPRARTRMVRSADGRTIRWEEHLGRASANFAIHFGSQILVTSSRALARSPHVLYTNVVEALLRFVFVDRGYMLLHAACMDVDGRGLMLSARTDTGKTGTVLKLLRTSEGRFLSDDMTIIDSEGNAKSFPKPLTISEHTLRAVDAGDLSRREWARLRFQSRLHSKEGRGFAMLLAEHNVPIMTINGWTQRIIPPPKYAVQRLVPCELTTGTRIDRLFIIERGAPHHSRVPQSEAIAELLENTEDAYGFPPYRYLAEALSVGGLSYDELRERERLILVSAMESVQIDRLGSDDFTWAEQISAEVAQSSELSGQKVPFVNLTNTAPNTQNFLGGDPRNVPEADTVSGSEA